MPGGRSLSRTRQWIWGTVLLLLLAMGLLLTFLLRNTEVVNPDIVQRRWIQWRQHR